MFCPVCRDEFRSGFTRCAACDVDLVETLGDARDPAAPPRVARMVETTAAPVSMAEYCGFVSLEEARAARDRLRLASVRSEIVIRDAPHVEPGAEPEEEYWLHVDRDRFRQAFALLGFDEATHEPEDHTFQCGECGAEVAAEESFCPKCGARFEEA